MGMNRMEESIDNKRVLGEGGQTTFTRPRLPPLAHTPPTTTTSPFISYSSAIVQAHKHNAIFVVTTRHFC